MIEVSDVWGVGDCILCFNRTSPVMEAVGLVKHGLSSTWQALIGVKVEEFRPKMVHLWILLIVGLICPVKLVVTGIDANSTSSSWGSMKLKKIHPPILGTNLETI